MSFTDSSFTVNICAKCGNRIEHHESLHRDTAGVYHGKCVGSSYALPYEPAIRGRKRNTYFNKTSG